MTQKYLPPLKHRLLSIVVVLSIAFLASPVRSGTLRIPRELIKANLVHEVRTIIQAGADVNARDDYGCTPLILALGSDSLDVARLLLDSGANVDAKDDNGFTALMWFAAINFLDKPTFSHLFRRSLEGAQLLIEKGADIEARDKFDRTPLMVAAEENNLHAMLLLIENGANLEARSSSDHQKYKTDLGLVLNKLVLNKTVLMWAVSHNALDAAALLILKGVDIDAEGSGGQTALLQACMAGNPAQCYLDWMHLNTDWSFQASRYPPPPDLSGMVRELIENGANVNAKDEHGRTPLMCAAQHNSLYIANLLLEKGANVNMKNAVGWTAFKIAKDQGYTEMQYLLGKYGAR